MAINLFSGGNIINSLEAAGKNKIINGDFGVWQRGTSFNIATGTEVFGPDRFKATSINSAGTASISRQTFTPGTAPVAGYEGSYFCRLTAGTAGSPLYLDFFQKVEDVRTFAGQTVTLSFWAKSSVAYTLAPLISQDFGSGGSGRVDTSFATKAITTSWARYSVSVAVPSISGKTIGTSSSILVYLCGGTVGASQTIDFWGVQLEAGSTATAFQTATGTIQGELAACQRYYWQTGLRASRSFGVAQFVNTVDGLAFVALPVTMRVNPSNSVSAATDFEVINASGSSAIALTAISFGEQSVDGFTANLTTASGMTAGQASLWRSKSAGNATLKVSAEL